MNARMLTALLSVMHNKLCCVNKHWLHNQYDVRNTKLAVKPNTMAMPASPANTAPCSKPRKNKTMAAPNGKPDKIPANLGPLFSATTDKANTMIVVDSNLMSNKVICGAGAMKLGYKAIIFIGALPRGLSSPPCFQASIEQGFFVNASENGLFDANAAQLAEA